jgi:hypothetical protein
LGVIACWAVLAALLPAAAAAADRYNSRPYRQIVTVPNMLQHEQALQNIANANGGIRLAGTSGNDQTIDYIASTMTAAGWAVQKQPFVFSYFQELAPATFSQTVPSAQTFVNGTDFATMTYSGSGDVTANVTAVGPLNVPIGDTPPGTTISGCAASDFAGFPVGNIALVQRGTCTFGTKANNAAAAGASAIVIFNEGQTGRTGPIAGTLGAPVSIPALGATYQLGVDAVTALRNGQTVTWHVTTTTISENRTTTTSSPTRPGVTRIARWSSAPTTTPSPPGQGSTTTGRARRWTSSWRASSARRASYRATTCASCGSAPRKKGCWARTSTWRR